MQEESMCSQETGAEDKREMTHKIELFKGPCSSADKEGNRDEGFSSSNDLHDPAVPHTAKRRRKQVKASKPLKQMSSLCPTPPESTRTPHPRGQVLHSQMWPCASKQS